MLDELLVTYLCAAVVLDAMNNSNDAALADAKNTLIETYVILASITPGDPS